MGRGYFRALQGTAAFVVVLLCLCRSAHASTPSSVDGPISAAIYDARLASVQTDIEQSLNKGLTIHPTSAALADLAPIVRCAVIFQGTVVMVDNRALRSTLTRLNTPGDETRVTETSRAVIAQISLLREGLNTPSNVSAAQRAEALAKKVLSGDDFASDPIAPPSAFAVKMREWLDALGKWLHKLLKKFHFPTLSPMKGPPFDPNIAKGILIGIGLLAVVLILSLVVRLVFGILENRKDRAAPVGNLSNLAMTQEEEALIQAGDYNRLMLLARQNAAGGEYRNAYRLVYLAALVLLDSTGNLHLNRSWTNWEYLRHIESAGKDEIYNLMAPLTADFDRIWYGQDTVDHSAFDNAALHYDLLHAAARGLASSAPGKVQP